MRIYVYVLAVVTIACETKPLRWMHQLHNGHSNLLLILACCRHAGLASVKYPFPAIRCHIDPSEPRFSRLERPHSYSVILKKQKQTRPSPSPKTTESPSPASMTAAVTTDAAAHQINHAQT